MEDKIPSKRKISLSSTIIEKTVILFLTLFVSQGAYSSSFEEKCQSSVIKLSEAVTSLRIKRAGRVGYKKGARILKRILRKKPPSHIQREIAYAARSVERRRGFIILEELSEKKPPAEVQENIIQSLIVKGGAFFGIMPETSDYIKVTMRILENLLKMDLSNEMLRDIFYVAGLMGESNRGYTEGMSILKKIHSKNPSMEMWKVITALASKKGDADLLKELAEQEDLSIEKQKALAFFAGRMEGPDGLNILEVLKEKDLSFEELQFAFSAGKTEKDRAGSRYSRSSNSSGAGMVTMMGGMAGF